MTGLDVHGRLSWRPLREADLPLLAQWLSDPRVYRWWNHDYSEEGVARDFAASVRGEEPGEDLVALLDGQPFGLLQRSPVAAYPEDLQAFEALLDVPAGALELDYLIGPPELRGRGLGPRLLRSVIERSWDDHPDAPCVLVAVVAANRASWRALEKAGLQRVAEGDIVPDNPVDDPLHYVYRAERPV